MIRITRQSDYGLLLLSMMAEHPAQLYNSAELSALTQVPLPTVSKILKLLVRGVVLKSYRGARGGYRLVRPLSEISVANVLDALEGPLALTDCIEGGPGECDLESTCRVRSIWQRINNKVREALEDVFLTELVPHQHGQPQPQAAQSQNPDELVVLEMLS